MTDASDLRWMLHALRLAAVAAKQGEVPVGAVLVDAQQTLVSEGMNAMIRCCDPTAHAEIMALRAACGEARNYRLPPGSVLYTTLEPCAMCAGAIIHARLDRLVYAAADPKAGAAGSVLQVLGCPSLNHSVAVCRGILASESAGLLQEFFAARRQRSAEALAVPRDGA